MLKFLFSSLTVIVCFNSLSAFQIAIDTTLQAKIYPLAGHVADVCRDSTGKYWIGTNEGLYMFDGYSTHSYQQLLFGKVYRPRINDMQIVDSILWIGTDEGLYKLNLSRKSITVVQQLAGTRILKVNSDTYKNIWIAALTRSMIIANNGLPLEGNQLKVTDLSAFLSYGDNGNRRPVLDIIFNTDTAYISAFRSVFKVLTLPSGRCKLIEKCFSIDDEYIKQIIFHKNHLVFLTPEYIGIYNGQIDGDIIKVDFKGATQTPFLNTIAFDNVGKAYVSTRAGGVIIENLFGSTPILRNIEIIDITSNLNNTSQITSLNFEKDRFFLGTKHNGLCVVDQGNPFIRQITAPFGNEFKLSSDRLVTSLFYGANNKLWIATLSDGLKCWDIATNTTCHYRSSSAQDHIPKNYIISIINCEADKLWFMSQKEIGFINYRTHKYRNLIKKVPGKAMVASDFMGRLWVGANGVKVYSNEGKIWKEFEPTTTGYPFANADFSLLKAGQNGKIIYLVSADGFDRLLLDDLGNVKQVTHISLKNFSPKDALNGTIDWLIEESDSVVYTLVSSQYLNRIAINPKTYNVNVQILDPCITGIQSFFLYQNRLWLMSDKLYVFNYNSQYIMLEQVINGIPENCYLTNAIATDSSGVFYVGTSKGLFAIEADSIIHNKVNSRLYVSQIIIGGKKIDPNCTQFISKSKLKTWSRHDQIMLSHNQNSVSIQMGIANGSTANPAWCLYQLNKAPRKNSHWQQLLLDRSAVLTLHNLYPGKYELIFKKGSEQAPDVPCPLRFKIKRPLLGSFVFILIYILIFLLITFLFIKTKFRKINIQRELYTNNQINDQRIQMIINLTCMLRTPLMLMSSPIKKLRAMAQGKEIVDDIHIIESQTQKMLESLDSILGFKNGFSNSEKASYAHVKNIAQYCCDVLEGFAITRQIHILQLLPNELYKGVVDKHVVQRIIANTLHYAIANSDCSKNITIELVHDEKNYHHKTYTLVKEIDRQKNWHNQLSILSCYPKSIKNDIIQQFACCAKRRFVKQTGVISHITNLNNLTQQLNGEFHVISNNKGHLEFLFLFDNNQQGHFDEHIPCLKLKSDKVEDLKPDNTKVIVVEQDPDLRLLIKQIASKHGTVASFGNGVEAIKAIREVTPDLVITDWLVPKMNGIELVKKLKSDIETNHIPVIMVSGKCDIVDMKQATQAGVDYFVPKPFDVEYLSNLIENIIHSRRVWSQKFKHSMHSQTSTFSDLKDKLFHVELNKTIMDNLKDPDFKYDKLALNMNMSNSALFRKMKESTGKTPGEYIKDKRIEYAANLFIIKGVSVSEASFLSGFKSVSFFSEEFKKRFGTTPSEYKRKNTL